MQAAYGISIDAGPLRQGEILSNVVEIRLALASLMPDADLQVEEIIHPFVVVLTQDCDLDWDYKSGRAPGSAMNAGKLIPNVLFCQADHAEALRSAQGIKSDIWRRISNNADERYHVLPEVPAELDRLSSGIAPLGLDFKRVFTVPTDELYRRLELDTRRRCFLLPPFLHSLSTRFTYFAGRVGLPMLADGQPTSPLPLPPVQA